MWLREQGDLCGELEASKAGNAQTLVSLSQGQSPDTGAPSGLNFVKIHLLQSTNSEKL